MCKTNKQTNKLSFCICISLQRKCEAISGSNLSFGSTEEGKDIIISVSGAHFNQSVWSAIDINFHFVNSDMKFLVFSSNGRTSKTQLVVVQSQIGVLYLNNANARLDNCSSIGANISRNKTYLKVNNSKVSIISLHTKHFYGGVFLHVTSGFVHMANVLFIRSESTASLIHAVQESFLDFQNCTFVSNDNVLINCEGSNAAINNSCFKNNQITPDTKVHNLIRITSGMTIATNSLFLENTIFHGGTVGILHGSIAVIQKCRFEDNKGRGVHVENSSNILITNSLFHRNSATFGAAIAVKLADDNQNKTNTHTNRNTSADSNIYLDRMIKNAFSVFDTQSLTSAKCKILSCTFVGNTAGNGGAILMENVSLALQKNNFTNNSATEYSPVMQQGYGGAITLLRCETKIDKSIFDGNEAYFGGAIAAMDGSLFISSSVFTGNQAVKVLMSIGGAICHIQSSYSKSGKMLLSISTSTFQQCVSNQGGAIKADYNVQVLIQQCTFEANKGDKGGAVSFCSGKIVNSHFVFNTANTSGGGLLLQGSDSQISVVGTSFASNVATSGGGIYGEDTISVVMKFCSFENNSAGFLQGAEFM